MNPILIGSMLWVTPDETDEQMEKDILGMLAQGLKIARIFISTDFATWDRFFALCEKHGLLLTITLGSLSNPGSQMGKAPDAEQYARRRAETLKRIGTIVEHYKDSKAVHSWILQNEPILRIEVDSCTLPMFRRWLLEEKYQYDLDALKAVYFHGDTSRKIEPKRLSDDEKAAVQKEYESLRERIGFVYPDGRAELNGIKSRNWAYMQRVDWPNFNEWLMNTQLTEANALVKSIDPHHPTTINPAGCATLMPADGGQNIYGEGKNVDFLGCSCHVSWHSTRFSIDRVHQSVSMYCDEMRCATADPDEYYWITELQSGTNFFSGGRPMVPEAEDITHWLWEAIGAGCKGMIYWLYSPRPSGFECLEWGLMNQQGGPSRRSRASKAVSDVLTKHSGLFASVKPGKYDGYLLHSYDSITLSWSERINEERNGDIQNPRNGYMIRDALCGAYLMLQDAGYNVGFLNEKDMDARLKDAKFVIAPNTYGLSEEVIRKLRDYVENGGTLIVDGLFGAKNPYGHRSGEETNNAMRALFGDTVTDWGVDTRSFSFMLNDRTELPAWFLNCNWENEENLTVLARDKNGYASAVEHRLGKGRAVYIGTLFFQHYFAEDGIPGCTDFIRSLLPRTERMCRLSNVSPFLRMKVLDGERDVVILLNRGDRTEALIEAEKPCTFRDLITGEEINIHNLTAVPMERMQVRVFASEK